MPFFVGWPNEEVAESMAALYVSRPLHRKSLTDAGAGNLPQSLGAGVMAQVEQHNAHGRSDLEFDAGDFHWVIELKFLSKAEGSNDNRVAAQLAAAIEQSLTQHYGESTAPSLIRIAAVFSETTRSFTGWRQAD